MLSELSFLFFLILLSIQSASLWSSLIIIPMSISMVVTSSFYENISGMMMILYIMIFIGGLLVLLVSVASISFNEQSYLVSFMSWALFLMFLLPLLLEYKCKNSSEELVVSIVWFEQQSYILYNMFVLLLVSLIIMTYLLLFFKGLIRSLYNYFI